MTRRDFPRKVKAAAIARANGHCECNVDGCSKPLARRGLCHAHYWRLRKYGDVGTAEVMEKGKAPAFIKVAAEYDAPDCLLWPYAKGGGGSGHLRIRGRDYTAHRLVCILVHGEAPTPKHEVAHSCGNGHLGCCNPQHLRWATHRENESDKLEHGTRIRGSSHASSKLTECDVIAIRKLRSDGKPLGEIAETYGVSISLISMIHSRKVWGWLDA